ncbi:MAG: ATP-binding protein [Deltaproteobacteria bacterium]
MNRLRICFADAEVERRFRIDSFPEETRLGTAILGTWVVVFAAFARNDFLLHEGRTLAALVAVRVAIIGSLLAAIWTIRRSRDPALRDAVQVLATFVSVAGGLYVNYTRPESLSPLFALNVVGTVSCWVLLPLPARLQALSAAMVTAGAVTTLLFKSRPYHPVEVVRVTLEFLLANGIGAAASILSNRSRRARWAAVLASEEASRALVASQRQLADARVTEIQSQLIQVQRAGGIGSLAVAIAHELSQPLTAARNCAHAGGGYLDQEPPGLTGLRTSLEGVEAGLQKASEIIQRLRDYLRRGEVRREMVSPVELGRDALALVEHAAAKRGVTLSIDVSPDAPEVTGDRVQLVQVIIISLVNAMDAMESTPGLRRVRLWARPVARGLEMGVDDEGPGIAPENAGRVFEAFFTTKKEGMGMGLPIARSIIEAHGGSISAEAGPGGGTRVAWTIPLGEASRPP